MSKFSTTIFQIILIFLANSMVIKDVEAQRPFQQLFYRLQDFFANLRPSGNKPSTTPWQDSSDHVSIQEPVDFDTIGLIESEPELVTTIGIQEPEYFDNIGAVESEPELVTTLSKYQKVGHIKINQLALE